MAFQRLNIRAKKSPSELYAFNDAKNRRSAKGSVAPHDALEVEEDDDEEFGSRLERCKGSDSKEKVSKRKQLFGSLRSFRSLANLHSSPNKARQEDVESAESPQRSTGGSESSLPASPSIALLKFEQSPPNKPMFDLDLHSRSTSGSSSDVQHSSPMAMPASARRGFLHITSAATDLPAGTIPDTPDPMQRAFNRDPANQTSWLHVSPTPLERHVPSTPVLTPLPGTNLSVGDFDPDLVPLTPSMNSSSVRLGSENPGYFDIPVVEQPQIIKTDKPVRMECLTGASDRDNHVDKNTDTPGGISRQVYTESCSPSARVVLGLENVKLSSTLKTPDVSRDQASALRRTQQAAAFEKAICALKTPQHHQSLSFCLYQNEGDPQGQIRKDLVVSEDWETCSSRYSIDAASEQMPGCPNQPRPTGTLASSTTPAPRQRDNEAASGGIPPVAFACIGWNVPKESGLNVLQPNAYAGNGGLYDGSGYGNEDSGSVTPGEPDEGTQDVHEQSNTRLAEASPVILSSPRGHSEAQLSNRVAETGNPYLERAQKWSPLHGDEEYEVGGLEFIYRAYT